MSEDKIDEATKEMNNESPEQSNGEESTMLDEELRDELRSRKQNVTLSNQQIIQFAYAIEDLISPVVADHRQLFFEEANCFFGCFYHVRQLLAAVDAEYLEQHERVAAFYLKELCIGNSDNLFWKDEVEELQGRTEILYTLTSAGMKRVN